MKIFNNLGVYSIPSFINISKRNSVPYICSLETSPIVKFNVGLNIFEPRHEKTNVLVSDPVRHKPGCTATEDG